MYFILTIYLPADAKTWQLASVCWLYVIKRKNLSNKGLKITDSGKAFLSGRKKIVKVNLEEVLAFESCLKKCFRFTNYCVLFTQEKQIKEK